MAMYYYARKLQKNARKAKAQPQNMMMSNGSVPSVPMSSVGCVSGSGSGASCTSSQPQLQLNPARLGLTLTSTNGNLTPVGQVTSSNSSTTNDSHSTANSAGSGGGGGGGGNGSQFVGARSGNILKSHQQPSGPSTCTSPVLKNGDNHSGLIYEECVLKSGSLESLVRHLVPTGDYYPDRAYIFAFILSSRLFIRPNELLATVFHQTFANKSEGVTEAKVVRQLVQFLGEWAEMFPYDFKDDNGLMMANVRAITQKCVSIDTDVKNEVSVLLTSLLARLTALEKFESILQRLSAESIPLSQISASPTVLAICPDPNLLAEQLTHIELERFYFIGAQEYIQAFLKESPSSMNGGDLRGKELKKSRLESYVEWFHHLGLIVATDVCKICYIPRGIALGGSSSVNGMLYSRGNAKDYDRWANFTKDPIWSSASVTVAFKAIETYHGWWDKTPGPTHGTKGQVNVEKMHFLPGADTFYRAAAQSGYSIRDVNSLMTQNGFSKMDHNMKHGIRWGTYHAFLEPILGRRNNLNIYRYSRATKIHFDDKIRAKGVTYKRHGKTHYAAANKEIILSAGAFESPKLLLLSGIGAQKQLAEFGIRNVLNLPSVGNYLQDHLGVRLPGFLVNNSSGNTTYKTPANVLKFIRKGAGPYQWTGSIDREGPILIMGYISSKINQDKSWPDIFTQIHQKVIDEEENLLTVKVFLGRPEQRGTIKLASSNPEDNPLMDPQIFDTPEDLDRIVDGIVEMTNLMLNSRVYKALGIRWNDKEETLSECDDFEFATRDYWGCYVKIKSYSDYHPTSTCRMGRSRSNAVVDSRLRVFGTTGLRVVDASVMPYAPNGQTNFPSIMVGEMGSKIILNKI